MKEIRVYLQKREDKETKFSPIYVFICYLIERKLIKSYESKIVSYKCYVLLDDLFEFNNSILPSFNLNDDNFSIKFNLKSMFLDPFLFFYNIEQESSIFNSIFKYVSVSDVIKEYNLEKWNSESDDVLKYTAIASIEAMSIIVSSSDYMGYMCISCGNITGELVPTYNVELWKNVYKALKLLGTRRMLLLIPQEFYPYYNEFFTKLKGYKFENEFVAGEKSRIKHPIDLYQYYDSDPECTKFINNFYSKCKICKNWFQVSDEELDHLISRDWNTPSSCKECKEHKKYEIK